MTPPLPIRPPQADRRALVAGVAGVIVVLLLATAVDGAASWIDVRGSRLQAAALGWFGGWLLLLGVSAWLARGWRRQPLALRVVNGLVLAVVAAGALLHGAPRLPEMLALARGGDPLGELLVQGSRSGRALALHGWLGAGDAARLAERIAASPALERIELALGGARRGEAEQLAAVLRQRRLATRLVGDCDGACWLVFIAGQRRQASDEGRLGLQRLQAPSLLPWWRGWAAADQRRLFATGLPAPMAAKAGATPAPALWRPDAAELATALLTAPPHPVEVDLPPAAAELDEWVAALRTNALWLALERRTPGSIAAVAARASAARDAGDDAAAAALHAAAREQLDVLLAAASAEMRMQFAELLALQLAAVPDGACAALLAGDAAVRRSLPAELTLREAAWIVDAAAEAPQPAAHALRPLEHEVLRRLFNDRGSALLARLWPPAGSGQRAPDCDAARALLRRLLSLGIAERRLALRLAFER